MDKVTIYISGQVDPNPGPGAYAAALYFRDAQRLISGDLPIVTNHEADLHAAIEAFQCLTRTCSVEVITCNLYLVNKCSGKMDAQTHPELWADLRQLVAPHDVQWTWHQKNTDKRLDEIRHYAMNRLMHPEAIE